MGTRKRAESFLSFFLSSGNKLWKCGTIKGVGEKKLVAKRGKGEVERKEGAKQLEKKEEIRLKERHKRRERAKQGRENRDTRKG